MPATLPTGASDLQKSGAVYAGRLLNATIGGSLIAGVDASASGALPQNANIGAEHDIVSVIGNVGANGTTQALIFAYGQANLSATAIKDVAIGKTAIGGRPTRRSAASPSRATGFPPTSSPA